MMKTVYWITTAEPRCIAILGRPRGNDWLGDEIKGLNREGVNIIVSLLTPDEAADLGLQDESRFCEMSGIQFFSLPVEERSVPNEHEVRGLVDTLAKEVKAGRTWYRGVGCHPFRRR